MIEQIKNIGHVITSINGKKDLIELWTKDTKEMDNVIIIDVNEKNQKITKELVSFIKMFTKMLFFIRQEMDI